MKTASLIIALTMLSVAVGTSNMAPAATPANDTPKYCGIDNNAFQSGEYLSYDLYFNWKFVWVKVGSASMSTVLSRYKGQNAYRASLITRTGEKLDNVFMLRDTLLSYCSTNLEPLYYRKGAREGDRYYVDELWYSYNSPDALNLKMHRIDRHGEHKWKDERLDDCVYDMMSIFLRARNFDTSGLKKGDVIPLPMSDAKGIIDSWLTYQGRENFEIEGTGKKFRCQVFSFMEREDGKESEIIKFYITDDANRIPVRLDMFLKFGTAKAFLKGYKGVKNPMTSRID